MAPDEDLPRSVREVRLEGSILWLAGGVLVAALVAAFLLGRWIERQDGAGTGGIAQRGEGVGAGQALEPADVSETATHFDTVTGGEKEPEPAREVGTSGRQSNEAASPGEDATRPRRATRPEGPHQVQVVAARDRAGVEQIVRSLESKGYSVHLVTEREGQGTLFKVRVGGYASRQEAIAVADRLKREGHTGAWVPSLP